MNSVLSLEVDRVSKQFGIQKAVTNVSFGVAAGEVVGLLGRNGAGKSTTVRMCVGIEAPSEGRVTIQGLSPRRAAEAGHVGYCAQQVALFPTRTVEDNLRFFGEAAGLLRAVSRVRIRELASQLGLDSVLRRVVGELSGGFQRRVHVAAALIADPPLLVLDEPTAGTDVDSRLAILEVIRARREYGAAIVYTSHDFAEIEALCDRLVILGDGEVRAAGTLEELTATAGQLIRIDLPDAADRDGAREKFGVRSASAPGETTVDVWFADQNAHDVLRTCDEMGWNLRRFELVTPGLEALFLQLTGSDRR